MKKTQSLKTHGEQKAAEKAAKKAETEAKEKETHACECGGTYQWFHRHRHMASKKHLTYTAQHPPVDAVGTA